MNKPILATLVGIVFFAIGLVATYMAMPIISPDKVETVQSRIDSLDAIKRAMAEMENLPDSLQSMPDSLMTPDSLMGSTMLTGLRDSLNFLIGELEAERSTKDTLLMRIQGMEERWLKLAAKFADAGQMSNTITKMEDKELSELLSKLDDNILESMYIEASSRNRARLLQMLPADKAAILVSRLTDPSMSFTTDSDPMQDPTQQE